MNDLYCSHSRFQPQDKEVVSLEDLLVSFDGGLQNVVVFLDGTVRNESEPAVLARITDCHFHPRILVMTPREVFRITDEPDWQGYGHGLSWPGLATRYGRKLPGGTITFNAEWDGCCPIDGLDPASTHFEVNSPGHPWMVLHCLFDRRVYAITDAGGFFEFPDVAPGHYSMTFWHERLGSGPLVEVDVTAGATSDLGALTLP